jgi:hypothetical protein
MAAPSGAYTLIRAAVTTSTAITINQVLVPAVTAAECTRAWCNQSTITTTNQTRIQLNRCATAGTVTSQAATPAQNGMQASKCVNSATATGITATIEPGTANTWWSEGFNIVNGILYLPVPEARMLIVGAASGTGTPLITLKFPTAPASADYTSGIEWLEYAN